MTLSGDALILRVGGRQFSFPRDHAKCGVVYENELATAERSNVERDVLGRAARVRFEVPGVRITLLDHSASPADDRLGPLGAEARLGERPEVAGTFPVFTLANKRLLLLPRVSVGFDPARTDPDLIGTASGLSITMRGEDYVILEVPPGTEFKAHLEALANLRGVTFAEPDLVTIGARIRPTEAGFSAFATSPDVQRAFLNIRAPEGWTRAGSLDAIRIAILDDGVDIAHPALAEAAAGSFDAITGQEGPIVPNGWDYHGTACAGLALGKSNAPAFRGIAGGARLLAVRVAQSPGPNQPWATSNSTLRRGIDWAVDKGADVLSNSWGGPPSSIIVDGLARALSEGRSGRGSVVVVAAGNSGGPVEFPATLAGVIAVSAVNLDDEPKTFSSSDGETWWASNRGDEIDIAAPGVGLKTTDLPRAAGRTPQDWRDDFNGTSAACPIVAGAAALVLSQTPTLDAAEVMQALTGGAAKTGGVSYDGVGRNPLMGAGRLDIVAALARDTALARISGRGTRLDLGAGVVLWHLAAADGPALFLPDVADINALVAAEGGDIVLSYAAILGGPPIRILRGARLVSGPPPASRPAQSPEPSPGEVWLPRPEDDIFALTYPPVVPRS